MTRAVYPSLRKKRVLVTGGASGIVEAFVGQGARVAFYDIAEEEGRALTARLPDNPPLFHACDLTDLAQATGLVEAVVRDWGGLDVLVNNAANDDRHPVEEVTPAYWEDRMAVNLRHLFFTAQGAAAMTAQGGRVILNLGSSSWHLGLPNLVLYQTVKAAIEGLTRGLARDLGRAGMRVNLITPGNSQTPRQQRWCTPEGEADIVAAQRLDGRIQPADVAAIAPFLASDDARMCTGHDYWVDAGWR